MRPKEYALNDSLSPSEIKHLINGTPYAFYYHKYANKDDVVRSDALVVGSYLHCKWLEPQKISSRYYVAEYKPKNTKEGKDLAVYHQNEYAKLAIENPDLIYIEDRLTNPSNEIYDALKDHDVIKTILSQNKIVETPIQDVLSPVDNATLKCIPDVLLPDNGIVIDFKHMLDISPSKFSRDVLNYNYHVQAWINLYCVSHVLDCDMSDLRFEFLCISKEAPYEVARYELAQEFMIDAEKKVMIALKKYAEAKEKGFKSYPHEVQILEAPAWLNYDIEVSEDVKIIVSE
jgi:hypothetical protein